MLPVVDNFLHHDLLSALELHVLLPLLESSRLSNIMESSEGISYYPLSLFLHFGIDIFDLNFLRFVHLSQVSSLAI